MADQTRTLPPTAAALLLAVLVTLLVAAATRSGLLEGAELQGFDLLASLRGFTAPAGELLFIDFDDAAMNTWGVSQIPRDKLAQVVEKASAGGAEIIGLDIFLDERRAANVDAKLSEAIASADNVILASTFGLENLPPVEPLPQFRDRALATAFANLPLDSDGVLRRMFLATRVGNASGESFPLALAENYVQQPIQRVRPGVYRLAGHEIALDPHAEDTALIGAWSAEPAQTIPVLRMLDPGFDAQMCKGKIVLVGQSSAKGKDTYITPAFRFRSSRSRLLPGTQIHAAAVAALLHGGTVRTLSTPPTLALILFLSAVVLIALLHHRLLIGLASVLVGLAVAALIAEFLFFRGVWLPFISVEAGVLLAMPAGFGYRYVEERRLKAQAAAERRELMGLFGRYVSPEAAAEIWRRRSEILLAGQEMTATVLFSDIRNFTALTAGKPSAQVLAWLNEYFTAMSEVIRRNGGLLNKYIGDGLLVLFGVPLAERPELGAGRAVAAALDMLDRVAELNAQRDGDRPRLEIGIGVHTGPLTAGSVGARDRLEYSVIGETVNLASRLEALSKEFHTPIVLSPQTHALIKDQFATRALGETSVRGFVDKMTVYTAARVAATEEPR